MNTGSVIELEKFERVDAVPGTALLRVAARQPSWVAANRPPTLVIVNGDVRRRLDLLPGPPGEPGLLCAAYSSPVALLDQGPVAFLLEFPDGVELHLPTPTRRHPRGGGAEAPRVPRAAGGRPSPRRAIAETAEFQEERRLRIRAERGAESRRHAIAELDRRLLAEQDKRAEADNAIQRSSDAYAEALTRLAETEQALTEERTRAAKERTRVAEELESKRTAAAHGEARTQALTAEVAEARSRAEIAEEGLAEANVRVDELGRERDEAMAFAGQAREIVGSLQERASEFGERTAALAAVLAPGDQSTGELDHSGPETYDDAAS